MKSSTFAKINPIKPVYFLASLVILQVFSACQREPVDLRIQQMDATETAKLAQSTESLVNPQIADGLYLKLWATDSLISDPISIQIDDQGSLYYSRTNRQKNSEFDIRGHQDWEIESIGLQTIEDKRAFLRKVLSPENSDKNQWLKDVNGDGSHDWRDMTVEKEHIYRVADTDNDGLADFSQLILEDFNDEVTDVAGGLLKHEEDLFVAVGPDVWRLNDTNGDGLMDKKISISHGYGIHIGFGGHGMSGLTVGPEGRIYWGIGDIGYNGKGQDGTEWKYPNRGVIARSNPDGSDFEIFAMGVRNTHEFVFDEYNNLISVDNDGDHRGERERLVYLVNGSDTGWRINWQFGKYRDPKNNTYKVWMDEGLHLPRHEGQPAYITPCIENFVNGPTGMVYNPGTALGPAWKNTFFVAEFVGNPARSGVHAFKLEPKGATFELAGQQKVLGGVLATGLDFGPDGALYVADWIDGWGTKNHGRIWKLDDTDGQNLPERVQTKTILEEDFKQLKEDQLEAYLFHEDLRVRRKSQFELAKRGKNGAEVFQKTIQQKDNQLARINGIIGLSQLARMGKMDYAKDLIPVLKDSDPEIRAQAAKWIGDIRYKDAGDALVPLLKDENSRVRFFAAEALGRTAHEPAIQPIIQLLEGNNDEDAYIRHAASLALSRIGKMDALVALAGHPSAAVRLGAVLALRRSGDAGITAFLADENEYIVTEAARAINDDFSIEGALPALGDILKNPGFTNEALVRRAINANLRVGDENSLQNLVIYIGREGAPADMRAEAMNALSTWTDPSLLDRVDGRYRGEVKREPNLVKTASGETLIQLLAHQDKTVRINAVKALGDLGIEEAVEPLYAMLKNDREGEIRIASLRSLAALEYKAMDQAIEQALSDSERDVRVAGLDLIAKLDIPKDLMVNLLTEVVEKRTTEEKQAALLTLGAVPLDHSGDALEELLVKMQSNRLPAEILLELSEAIELSGSQDLKNKYDEIEKSLSPDSLIASYQGSLHGGNARAGRTIFFQSQSGQCIRCHAYTDYGSNIGPRLDAIANKISRKELLEALVDPDKRVAPGYGVVTLELKDNTRISGILEKEDGESITLKIGNDPDTVIDKEQIVSRKDAPSSMPDMKNLLSRREIRDLVSFLATLTDEYE